MHIKDLLDIGWLGEVDGVVRLIMFNSNAENEQGTVRRKIVSIIITSPVIGQ